MDHLSDDFLKGIMNESSKIIQHQDKIMPVEEQMTHPNTSANAPMPTDASNPIVGQILERVATIDRMLYEVKDLMRRI